MKRIMLLLCICAAMIAQAQTASEVIEKYTKTMGSLEGYQKLKTVKMTGTLTAQGMDLPITIQIVNGKGVRSDLEVMGTPVISGYRDGKGWKQNQFAGFPDPTEVTPAELADMKVQVFITSAIMDYKARGHQVELQGQEDVGGTKAFKIKLTAKEDGKVSYYYFSTADYSLIKSVTDREMGGASMAVETWYSDLKEVNGLKFYLSRSQKVGGEEVQAVKFDKVELDLPIDEKIFDMPK